MGGKYDIYIYDDPDNPGITLVRPSPAFVDRANKINVRNLTKNKIVLQFPPELIDDPKPWEVGPRSSNSFKISAKADGYYGYQPLLIAKARVHAALGNSGPSIIVDP
jgi:hypothetical protein